MRQMTGAALAMLMALSGCATWNSATTWGDNATARSYDAIAQAGTRIRAPWGSMRPGRPDDESITVGRVMGPNQQVASLTTEAGNVWPAAEGPRATLANPEAALRGIPNYRADGQPTSSAPITAPPPPRRGSSSPPRPRDPTPESAAPLSALPPSMDDPAPRRADGRVITTPRGPAITTGGTDRIQSYTTPGGGSGTAIRDGNVTTLIGPDGQVRTVLTPR